MSFNQQTSRLLKRVSLRKQTNWFRGTSNGAVIWVLNIIVKNSKVNQLFKSHSNSWIEYVNPTWCAFGLIQQKIFKYETLIRKQWENRATQVEVDIN